MKKENVRYRSIAGTLQNAFVDIAVVDDYALFGRISLMQDAAGGRRYTVKNEAVHDATWLDSPNGRGNSHDSMNSIAESMAYRSRHHYANLLSNIEVLVLTPTARSKALQIIKALDGMNPESEGFRNLIDAELAGIDSVLEADAGSFHDPIFYGQIKSWMMDVRAPIFWDGVDPTVLALSYRKESIEEHLEGNKRSVGLVTGSVGGVKSFITGQRDERLRPLVENTGLFTLGNVRARAEREVGRN
jgi:hypothetical protein